MLVDQNVWYVISKKENSQRSIRILQRQQVSGLVPDRHWHLSCYPMPTPPSHHSQPLLPPPLSCLLSWMTGGRNLISNSLLHLNTPSDTLPTHPLKSGDTDQPNVCVCVCVHMYMCRGGLKKSFFDHKTSTAGKIPHFYSFFLRNSKGNTFKLGKFRKRHWFPCCNMSSQRQECLHKENHSNNWVDVWKGSGTEVYLRQHHDTGSMCVDFLGGFFGRSSNRWSWHWVSRAQTGNRRWAPTIVAPSG